MTVHLNYVEDTNMNTNNAPDKIYLLEFPDGFARFWKERKKDDMVATIYHEYIRNDVVDETIKSAEDHAYFAGQEKFREKLLEWLENKIAKKEDGFVSGLTNLAYQDVINELISL